MKFLIPLLLFLLLLFYICRRFWQILPFGTVPRVGAVILIVGLFLLLPAFFVIRSAEVPVPLLTFIYGLSTSWFFILLYLFLGLLVLDLLRLMIPAMRPWFLHSWKGTLLLLVPVALLFLYGYFHYRSKAIVSLDLKVERPLKRPLRIVAVSDLHLGYTIGPREAAGWVELINAQQPDVVLIAGDIVDNSVRPLWESGTAAVLRGIKAPLGVYACMGNHDWLAGVEKSAQFMHESGIRLLRDEAVMVDSAFYIVGRDDRTNLRRASLRHLTEGLQTDLPVILLDHQPYHLEEAEAVGIDFQFSGHTHRGQVFPINLITDAIYECSHGYLRKSGRTHVYVSSGLGIWGGKFRIGSQSELVVATLHN